MDVRKTRMDVGSRAAESFRKSSALRRSWCGYDWWLDDDIVHQSAVRTVGEAAACEGARLT